MSAILLATESSIRAAKSRKPAPVESPVVVNLAAQLVKEMDKNATSSHMVKRIILASDKMTVEFTPDAAKQFVLITTRSCRTGFRTITIPIEKARKEYAQLVALGYKKW